MFQSWFYYFVAILSHLQNGDNNTYSKDSVWYIENQTSKTLGTVPGSQIITFIVGY